MLKFVDYKSENNSYNYEMDYYIGVKAKTALNGKNYHHSKFPEKSSPLNPKMTNNYSAEEQIIP